MSIVETRTDVWSDFNMHCPPDWYGGFKEGRLLSAGDAERALSDWFTGDYVGSTFRYSIADTDGRLRAQLASTDERYWTEPVAVRMTTRENRAVLGVPYTVFVGPIIDAQPTHPYAWEFTLGDPISYGILNDQLQVPWRKIGDGFLNQLDAISNALDRNTPEPIIYGSHTRAASDTSDTGEGYRVHPTYLGVWTVGGGPKHVWLVAGHACSGIDAIYVDDQERNEGDGWLIPGESGWNAVFGAPYVDLFSQTYGNLRRYTLILGDQGEDEQDACALGESVLSVAVHGVESDGDGTGALMTDGFEQYEHWLINFVANAGHSSYQSGSWLVNPQWTLIDGLVDVVDVNSFRDASDIAIGRLGSPSLGYVRAPIIGAQPGDRASVRRWVAEFNRSLGCRLGVTHLGQLRLVTLHPTQAIKDAALLYTDNYEIVQGTFGTAVRWDQHATSIPFRADLNHASGEYYISHTVNADEAIENYGRNIQAESREYPHVYGLTQATHIANLELAIRQHPPRLVRFEVPVGPEPVSLESLGYRDLGDYIRYVHYDAVTETREIRLAQVVRHQVRASQRTVLVEALDCEDLIDYDVDIPFESGEAASLCASGIEIDLVDGQQENYFLNTTDNPTDDTVAGTFPGPTSPAEAFHAVWFTFTAPSNGTLQLRTLGSSYNTQIAVYTGDCGSLVFEDYNDDFFALTSRSGLDVTVTNGETYHILIAGVGPDDGGSLTLVARFDA